MFETILWIFGITSLSLVASLIVRITNKPDAVMGLYISAVLSSVFAASKIAQFDLGFTIFNVPAGVLLFSLTFLLTDIVNEKFGRSETHKMVNITFLSLIATTLFSWSVLKITPAPFWSDQKAIEVVFGQVPRIVGAGWVSFFVSENLDAYLFDLLKRITKGKYLWSRNVVSSLPSMAVESILFASLAFYGRAPVIPIILGLISIKWLMGLVGIPFMYLNRFLMTPKVH